MKSSGDTLKFTTRFPNFYFAAASTAPNPAVDNRLSRFHRRASATSCTVTLADLARLAEASMASRLKNLAASSGTIDRGSTWSSATVSPACGPRVIVGEPPFRSFAMPSGVKQPKSSRFFRFQIIAILSAQAPGVPA